MQRQKIFFNSYLHYSIYFICAVIFSYMLDFTMPDDGLRHLSFAANNEVMQSWGNVYPHSLFGEYDPWFGWHYFLKSLLLFLPYEQLHIVINIISLFFLMLLLDAHIRKISQYNFSSLLYIMVFIIVMLTSYRYVMVRPDLLSGLYIMSALLLRNRFFPIFILTLLYGPFYYLFFMYTGSIGLVYLVQQKWKAFLGVFLGSLGVLVFFLLHNKDGYITTVLNILNDQKLRMGLEVTEGEAIFSLFKNMDYFILLPIFFIFSFALIKYKYKYFKENALPLFLIITSILWINQYRYYHLFMPLIFSFIFVSIVNMDKKRFLYNIRKYMIIGKRYFDYSKTKALFYVIAIPYSIGMLAYIFSSQSLNTSMKEATIYKEEFFQNKTMLLNKMDTEMFRAHYYNPTLKIVPSCSIGWFEDNKEMKNIYIRLQSSDKTITEEELRKLIDYIGADIYIHFFIGNEQIFNIEKLSKLGIIPNQINKNKIIFTIKKKNE